MTDETMDIAPGEDRDDPARGAHTDSAAVPGDSVEHDESTGPLTAADNQMLDELETWASDDQVWADDEAAESVAPVPVHDPWVQPLLAVILSLVAALLVSTGAIYIYLVTLNEAPRTVAEREIAAGEAAVAENPRDLNALTSLAYAYARGGRYEDALDLLEDAESLEGSEAMATAEADILRISGRHREAVEAYSEAEGQVLKLLEDVERDQRKKGVSGPVNSDALLRVYWGRGLSKQELGDLTGAIADLEAASRESSTQATVWATLGDLYARTQEESMAAEAYNNALRYVPDLPEAQAGLQRLKGGE